MGDKVLCFGPSEHGNVPWPETPEGDFTRRYLAPFMNDGTTPYISNVDVDVHVCVVDGVAIPYTVGSRGAGNSYVCAPQSHYVEYAEDELRHIEERVSYYATKAGLPPMRLLSRWGELNKVVFVNNWLLSTNLYPPVTPAHLLNILDAMLERYPDYAIVFRSIDMGLRKYLYDALSERGCRMVFSRRVHVMHKENTKAWKRSNTRYDLKLKSTTAYESVPHHAITHADFARIVELYNFLYIDKYSQYNPRFTTAFLEHLWREELWEFLAYRKDGQLDAVTGTFHLNGVGTGPLVGYDTSKSQDLGLYRLAYLEMIEAGRRREETTHCSAGVATYKQLRGADSYLEYNAVYDAHLPLRRRLPWIAIQGIMDRVVVPMILNKNL